MRVDSVKLVGLAKKLGIVNNSEEANDFQRELWESAKKKIED